MHTFRISTVILLTWGLFIFSLAADQRGEAESPKPRQIRKPDGLMLGMKSEETAALLGEGCHPKVDKAYEPEGFGKVIECKRLKLVFLRDRLYNIHYQSGSDLSMPLKPFRVDKYNLPVDVQRTIRWGMGVPEFMKALDRWADILNKSGLKRVQKEQLKKDEFSMDKFDPSRTHYWVNFGPGGRYSPSLPRVLWSFDFDFQSKGLSQIDVRDQDEQGFLFIQIK